MYKIGQSSSASVRGSDQLRKRRWNDTQMKKKFDKIPNFLSFMNCKVGLDNFFSYKCDFVAWHSTSCFQRNELSWPVSIGAWRNGSGPTSTRVIIAILMNVNVFNFIYRTRRNAGSGDHFTRETSSLQLTSRTLKESQKWKRIMLKLRTKVKKKYHA